MMRRLQAEEQLMAVNAAALGSGSVKEADARRALDGLERAANGGKRRVAKATPHILAAMGIAVIEQPARQAEAQDG